MDLNLFLRVAWRFRLIVLAGVMLAVSLSALSFARVSWTDGKLSVAYREHEVWESLSTLFVTTRGFPWGSTGQPLQPGAAPSDPVDPARLSSLAGLYIQLATTDAVYELMLEDGPITGGLQAFPVFGGNDGRGEQLPMITLSAIATTPDAAQQLAARHVAAFTKFLTRRQTASRIPLEQRVVVEVIRQPQPAVLLEPRKRTLPIIVFIAIMSGTLALTFVLENLRPQVRTLETLDVPAAAPRARRSA